jgi:hypothetical protein
MTLFHHKLLTSVLANGTHVSSMTIFVHLFIRSVIQKSYHGDMKYHITLRISYLEYQALVGVHPTTCSRLLHIRNPCEPVSFLFGLEEQSAKNHASHFWVQLKINKIYIQYLA